MVRVDVWRPWVGEDKVAYTSLEAVNMLQKFKLGLGRRLNMLKRVILISTELEQIAKNLAPYAFPPPRLAEIIFVNT